MTSHQAEDVHDPAGGRRLDVLVIGRGQTGLAMAWHLARQGLRFAVLDAYPELGQGESRLVV